MNTSNLNYAYSLVSKCLKIKPMENAIIFVDKINLGFAEDIAYFIKNAGAEVSIFYIANSIRPIEKITDIHSVSLISADIVIYILQTISEKIDLSKEMAFRYFLRSLPIQYKGRVCMMPGFSEEMKESIEIDYLKLNKKCECLKNILTNKDITIKTKLGSDITFSLDQRKLEIDDGDISNPGQLGNLPAGEIFTAPLEKSVNGKIIVDGSISGLGKVNYPFCIELESGYIVDIQASREKDELVDKFRNICELDLPATKTIGEFGIGLNPKARIIGNILMDEKVEGTVHFAFGDSYDLGNSKSKYHTDLLIKNPSIFANGKIIMDNGSFTTDVGRI